MYAVKVYTANCINNINIICKYKDNVLNYYNN